VSPRSDPKEDELVRYLLGELPKAERAALKLRIAGDDAVFQQVRELEDDLVDAYVRGELDYPQSAAEERKLRLARALAFKKVE
jgi:anti-sigma factor RsiW